MEKTWTDRVVDTAKTLNTILSTGVGILAAVALLRFVGAPDFTWAGAKLTLTSAWIVAIIFSIAHAWVGIDLIQQVNHLWSNQSLDENRTVFKTLTGTTGIFLRGLRPRLDAIQLAAKGRRFYSMSVSDPS